jgi:hypothetical protein
VKKECYCAFCKTKRSVYAEKSVRARHVFWSFLLSSALSFLIWRTWDPKSLLFFVVAIMGAESFIKIRWRVHMVCRSCGFDPVIYVKNPQKAAELVSDYMERRSHDPTALLRRPLNLPKRPQPVEKKEQKKIVSLKV